MCHFSAGPSSAPHAPTPNQKESTRQEFTDQMFPPFFQNVKSKNSLCTALHQAKNNNAGRCSFQRTGKITTLDFNTIAKKNQVLTNLFLLIYQLYMGEYTQAVHTLECSRYNLV
jgi:hypothetical protein